MPFRVLALAAAALLAVASAPPAADTMQVRGRFLYTAAGERVVLRGVNEMFPGSADPTGRWVMREIAKTGANGVRIMLRTNVTAATLDRLLANAVANGMIPIPECHAATGKWEKLPECVALWTRPEIAAVINRHNRWVVLNIANEAGKIVSQEDFVAGYRDAIARIRAAGIRTPLIVDGSDWGKEHDMLLDSWATLNASDPFRAVMVSSHSYWVGTEEERKQHYRDIVARVLADDIPFVLGEGPSQAGWDCSVSPYGWAMSELDRAKIGWLAWSWGLVPNGDCREGHRYDITRDGRFGHWKNESGRLIAIDHPASIRHTSRRPCSLRREPGCVEPDAS